jgi:hypothetical protein
MVINYKSMSWPYKLPILLAETDKPYINYSEFSSKFWLMDELSSLLWDKQPE